MTLAINAGIPLTNPQGNLTGTGLQLLLPATTASAAQITPGHVAIWVDRSTLADGGIPASGGTVTHTAGALTANQIVIGNGGADIKTLGTLGTTTTVLHGNAAGASTFAAVALAADVSGDLPFANLTPATAASRLLGRGSAAGAGDFQEITLGTGVTLTGTVLSASGSGTVTNTGTLTSGTLIQGNGGVDVTVNATTATVTKLTAGVPSAASAGTDYVAPGSITSDGITMNTARVLGRTTASAGAVEEMTVGTGLSLSAGMLTATGTGTGTSAIGITIDGGGVVLTTGLKGFVYVPRACTITAATLLSTDPAVLTGSIVMDVWKAAYASYPPTVANTITASAKPTITSAKNSQDTTLTGWTTSVSAGDVIGFNVDSVTTLQRVTLELTVTY